MVWRVRQWALWLLLMTPLILFPAIARRTTPRIVGDMNMVVIDDFVVLNIDTIEHLSLPFDTSLSIRLEATPVQRLSDQRIRIATFTLNQSTLDLYDEHMESLDNLVLTSDLAIPSPGEYFLSVSLHGNSIKAWTNNRQFLSGSYVFNRVPFVDEHDK